MSLLHHKLGSMDALAPQVLDTRINSKDVSNDVRADLAELHGKENSVLQVMGHIDSKLQDGFQSLRQTLDSDQNRFIAVTNSRIGATEEAFKYAILELSKITQNFQDAANTKTSGLEVKVEELLRAHGTLEARAQDLEAKVCELSYRLEELNLASRDPNAPISHRWSIAGPRAGLKGPLPSIAKGYSSLPASRRDSMVSPVNVGNPIQGLFDNKGLDEKDFEQYIETGAQTPLELARSPAGYYPFYWGRDLHLRFDDQQSTNNCPQHRELVLGSVAKSTTPREACPISLRPTNDQGAIVSVSVIL